jgi:type IV pilus assembly protein PilQ
MKMPNVRRSATAPRSGYLRGKMRALFTGIGLWVLTVMLAMTATAAPRRVTVTNVALTAPRDGAARVVVRTSARPTYSARIADGGKRILLDVSDAVISGAPPAIVEGNRVVSGILTQSFDSPSSTRVLIQLAHAAEYAVTTTDEGLTIDLVEADATRPAPAARVAATPVKASVVEAAAATIRDVRYGREGGRERVVIEAGADVRVSERSTKDALVLELSGARVPRALERTVPVHTFGGAVRSVSTRAKQGASDVVTVTVAREPGTSHLVTREGDAIVVLLASEGLSPSETGRGLDGGAARRTKVLTREDAPEMPRIEQTLESTVERTTESDQADAALPGMAAQATATPAAGADNAPRGGGRRIDLDLKDADIHDVLRLLADVGRVNVITGDNVNGSVTIRMRNVPWDQALETVLQAKGLGMVRKGNLIRVAPLADLNKERELALARAKSEFELAPLETRLVPVSYATAADMMSRAKDLLSPRGTIAVDERTNVLITRDITGNLNQVEELVRALDTQTPQVLIEARIVEAQSQFARDFGIQWGGGADINPANGVDTGLAFPHSIGVFGAADDAQAPSDGLSPDQNTVTSPNFAVNLPTPAGGGAGGAIGMTFGSINNLFNLSVRLAAAESSGTVRIISSPRVLTLDNKRATISAGTSIPFSQVSAQGVQTVFQEALLQLSVLPHVTADGSVSLRVQMSRDEPDFGNRAARGDPSILRRQLTTELLVQDGHTAVIGGIYTRNASRSVAQVPVLGDIPILGVLFQRRGTSDRRTELVVFITPRIVNRAEALGR